MTLADAIASFEGYGKGNNLPTRNNNPGDIVYGDFAASYGAIKDPNSAFAVFPDTSTGFRALNDLISGPSYSGLSLQDAISKWNGGGSNSGQYASTVSAQTGIPLTGTVGDYLSGGNGTDFVGSISSVFTDVASNTGGYLSDITSSGGFDYGLVAIFAVGAILVWELI